MSCYRDRFSDYLRRMPGLVSHGVVLQNPGASPREWCEIYEVRWLRGQPIPSLPSTIDGRALKLVVVDAYPVPHATVSGEGGGRGGFAKTFAIFAAFAIPAGILIAKMQSQRQLREEKTAFRRLGLDWAQRSR